LKKERSVNALEKQNTIDSQFGMSKIDSRNSNDNTGFDDFKTKNLQKKFSSNPISKQSSTNSEYVERKIKHDDIGDFDGLHDSDLYNTRDLEKQKSIQFVIDGDENPQANSFELKAGDRFEFVEDKDDKSQEYEVFYE